VTIPIAGLVSDRYGRKPILVGALLLFGVSGVAIPATTDFKLVLGLRFLQGIGLGGSMPIVTTSIGDLYGAADEATAQGLRLSMASLSATVFPLLAGALVLVAWQYPFLLYAMAIPIAGFVAVSFEEPVATESTIDSGRSSGGSSQLWAALAVAAQRQVATVIIGRGLPTFVWISFLTYNSIVVIRSIGGEPIHAGALYALGSLSMGAASSQAGRLTDRFRGPFYPLVAANLGLLTGLPVFLFAPGLWLAGLGAVIAGAGFGLALTLYRSTVNGLTDDTLRGSIVSLAEAFGRTVATSTPILTGVIISTVSPTMSIVAAVQIASLSAAVVGVGGGLLCLFILGSTSDVWQL
jgi:MFS family permease